MSQNPYEAGASFDPDVMEQYDDRPARTSVSAILSLLCSIPFCCVPLTGVLGVILGAMSLAFIGKSHGRVTGKPAAIAGIILGIATTALWTAVVVGFLQAKTYYTKNMVPVGEGIVLAMEQGDIEGVRAYFTQDANDAITDERIALFAERMDRELGGFVEAPTGIGRMIEQFAETFQGMQGQGGSTYNSGPGGPAPIPVAMEFGNGAATLWILADTDALDQQQVILMDAVLQLPTGVGVPMLPDGPGLNWISGMGMTLSHPEADLLPAGSAGDADAGEASGASEDDDG